MMTSRPFRVRSGHTLGRFPLPFGHSARPLECVTVAPENGGSAAVVANFVSVCFSSYMFGSYVYAAFCSSLLLLQPFSFVA